MSRLLSHLGPGLPILAAPMSGGPSTPALVTAAARAGGLGFLAAGYKTPKTLAEQVRTVRADGVPFGVNVFVPNPVSVSTEDYRDYVRAIRPEAALYGLRLPDGKPVEDDDHWRDKIDLLLADPVPVVSFTFGLPGRSVVAELRRAGTVVVQTVTSADEARGAAGIGVDAVVVQASAAGGHSATFTPAHLSVAVPLPELITRVRGAVPLPVIAAGGLGGPAGVAGVLAAGAEAAMIGTALLRTEESGASAPHKAALADPAFDTTVITRAFTGRPARALRNHFVERYDHVAPVGYPALHHLTGPLRKAATAAGDTRLMHLWAGTGHRHARTEPAARTFARLAGGL
ncbi:nitronate monooxygenase [Streptomyces sp. NPDC057746]|uniref:nitronate monooxygenase n=1 Tax=Streptomyces sp. NPDC057746 TaxID=3346237 RepID=UPI0036D20696